jgi:hypothetical protein
VELLLFQLLSRAIQMAMLATCGYPYGHPVQTPRTLYSRQLLACCEPGRGVLLVAIGRAAASTLVRRGRRAGRRADEPFSHVSPSIALADCERLAIVRRNRNHLEAVPARPLDPDDAEKSG